MAAPTFNINDLINPMGRQLASPFAYPTPAQQNPARPATVPAPVAPLPGRPQEPPPTAPKPQTLPPVLWYTGHAA